MDINIWFTNGCNYQEGVTLYASLKAHSPNLLRLFLRKESAANANKLEYELGKHREATKPKIVTPFIKAKPTSTLIDNLKKNGIYPEIVKVDTKTANSKNASFYSLNELHIDLHPLSIKQRTDYQTAISLHHKLSNCHPDEEGAALSLCIKIEDLFDAIETTQKVLDHYVKHKVVLNITPRSYKDYTGGQLADTRRNKRTSVTKYKKKVEELKLKFGQILS